MANQTHTPQTPFAELLTQYKQTACALHARKDRLQADYRTGNFVIRCDALRRLNLVSDMYYDVICTVREMEYYQAGQNRPAD